MAKKKLVTVTLSLPDGSRKYFRAATKKEAEAKRDKAKLMIAGGWSMSNVTFKSMAEAWLEDYASKPKIHDRTYETVAGIFDRYLIPEFGKMKLVDIKPMHIDLLLQHMNKLSVSTQRKALIYSNLIFQKAVENGIIPKSPALGKKPTAEAPEKVRALSDDQCAKLLNATVGTRVYPFVAVLLFAGLRKGEALGLMWKDIDFEKNLMKVERSIVYTLENKAGTINEAMKTSASHRVIPMSPQLVAILKEQKASSKSLYVFSRSDGSFLSESSFRRMWDLVSYRTIGGPASSDRVQQTLDFDVHPHQLRHTFCTRCIESGMNPIEVQYLMGHATSKMTMDVYSDYRAAQQLKETAKKLSAESLMIAIG